VVAKNPLYQGREIEVGFSLDGMTLITQLGHEERVWERAAE
jgi:hypothetical protein